MIRALLSSTVLALAFAAPATAYTPVESPTLRTPVKAPVVGNPCAKPGHICAPAPVRPTR